jgi:hypothetical protein
MDHYDSVVAIQGPGPERAPGTEPSTGFGAYLRDAIHSAGFATATHFAREAGTDPSVVLRWISEEQRPTIRSIERIAPLLGRSIQAMVHAAYPDRLGSGEPDPTPRLHPLAHDLGRILAPDSVIPADERHALEQVLTRLLEPYVHLIRRRRAGA